MNIIGPNPNASYDESKKRMAQALFANTANQEAMSPAAAIVKALTMGLYGQQAGKQQRIQDQEKQQDAQSMQRILQPEKLPWLNESDLGAMSRTAGYEAAANPRVAPFAQELAVTNATKGSDIENKDLKSKIINQLLGVGDQASTPTGLMTVSGGPDMNDPLNRPMASPGKQPPQFPNQQPMPQPGSQSAPMGQFNPKAMTALAIVDPQAAGSLLDIQKVNQQQREMDPTFISSKAANETYGKKSGEDFNSFMQSSMNASNNIALLDQVDALGDQADTGKFANLGMEGQKLADALGMKVDTTKMGAREAMTSIANQLTLKLRTAGGENQMPGQMSDADRAFLQKITPGLETTPAGRKWIVAWNKKLEQRNSEIGSILEQEMERNGGSVPSNWRKISRDYNKSHPLFTKEDFEAAKQLAGGASTGGAKQGNRPSLDSFFSR